MANEWAKARANDLLDEIDRDEITIDTLKQAWLDKHGCKMLPNNSFLGMVMKKHPRWKHMGNLKKKAYRRNDIKAE
jgi:hypothetical protein